MRDYKKSDELKEVTALKKQRHQLESELKGINCQSQWYHKRKSRSIGSPSATCHSRSATPQSDSASSTPSIHRGRLLSPKPTLLRSRSTTPLPISSLSDISNPTSPLRLVGQQQLATSNSIVESTDIPINICEDSNPSSLLVQCLDNLLETLPTVASPETFSNIVSDTLPTFASVIG